MYLAKRNPALDRYAFVERWRAHGALAMSTPRWKHIRRYAQCDAFREAEAIEGISDEYDGIGIVWPRSMAARQAYRGERDSQALLEQDEFETFDRPVLQSSVLCDERVLLRLSGGRLKLTRVLFADRAADAPPFDEFWSAHAVAILERSDGWGLCGYVQNHPMPPELPGGWGLPAAGIEEMWFRDLAGIRTAQSWLSGGHASFAAGSAWHRALAVVTTETVLYDVS